MMAVVVVMVVVVFDGFSGYVGRAVCRRDLDGLSDPQGQQKGNVVY